MDYPDNCIIGRLEGQVDAYGVEILTPIYSGECLLQITGQSKWDGFQYEHEPLLFIPINDKMFKINDSVKVTTWNGREINYTIKNWEAIKDDIEELNDTCIWLKDGVDEV